MMRILRKQWLFAAVFIFIIVDCFVWYVVWLEQPTDHVTIAFLNVGQGDSIYIESPTHNRIIIDGGPSSAILSELRKVMPFYERNIDTLIITNPDKDHYAGFLNVLSSYHVSRVMEPGTLTDAATYKKLEQEIKNKNIPRVFAKRGMVVNLGGGANLTILFPDKDVSTLKTNDGSIIAKLTYGSTSVMFTGDAPNKTEEYTLAISGTSTMRSDILKEGHHGSRTSASELFFEAVNPKWNVISAGFHNSYGHPHRETIDLLNKLHIPYLITYERGTIIFTCTKLDCRYKTEK